MAGARVPAVRGRAPVPADRPDRRLHAAELGRCRRCATPITSSTTSPTGRVCWSAATSPTRCRSASTGIPAPFRRQLFDADYDRFEQLAELAAKRTPVLEQAGIRTLINGPIPYSADADFVMGRAPELDNFFVATGFLYGIAAGGGAGKMMAEWILDGRPSLDLWPLDVRRFSFHHTTRHFMDPRMVELYGHHYKLAAPGSEHEHGARRAAQPAPRSPRGGGRRVRFTRRLGAAQLVRAGRRGAGRRAVVHRRQLVRARRRASTGAVRERCRPDRPDHFANFEIAGPGALAAVQWLSVADMDKSIGTSPTRSSATSGAGSSAT